MGKAEISRYIGQCLQKRYSFARIEQSLLERGYPKKVAEGIILSYRHRGRILKWLTVSALSVLFLAALYLSGSGIVGMVTLGYSISLVDELNLIVNTTSSYSWYVPDKGEIVSLSITGNLIGSGNVRVYIENNEQKFLIFDSRTNLVTDISNNLGQRHFSAVCEESCILEGFNKPIYNLIFEIDDIVLELKKIHYNLRAVKELPAVPEFLEISPLKISIGSKLLIDLNSFFNNSYGNAEFSFLAQDDSLNITIENAIAAIIPARKGISHLYFIAEVDKLRFMSNLVVVDVVETVSEPAGTLIKGKALPEKSAGIQEKSTGKIVTIVLLLAAMLAIFTLAVIPSKHYDISSLANKIDSIRNTNEITASIAEYKKMKSGLKNLSGEEKEKAIGEIEEKIRGMSGKILNIKGWQEFDEKCDEFEKAKTLAAREKIYAQLRKLYLRLIEARLRDKDKRMLYHKMRGYYRRLGK